MSHDRRSPPPASACAKHADPQTGGHSLVAADGGMFNLGALLHESRAAQNATDQFCVTAVIAGGGYLPTGDRAAP